MTGYAIGYLTNVNVNDEVRTYLEEIDATLAPFDGRFVIHGGRPEVKEGTDVGTLIVIAFPDLASARSWYDSPAYQKIIGYRTRNAEGVVFLLDGVDDDHKATDVLAG